MQLINDKGSWSVISDIGREYELTRNKSMDNECSYDIVTIFDFDVDHDYENKRVVGFFYGGDNFAENVDEASLNYIKKRIIEYENTYYPCKSKGKVIKEF